MDDIEWDANAHVWRDKTTGAWVMSPAARAEARAEAEAARDVTFAEALAAQPEEGRY